MESAQDAITQTFRSEGYMAGQHDRRWNHPFNDRREAFGDDYAAGYKLGWDSAAPIFLGGKRVFGGDGDA